MLVGKNSFASYSAAGFAVDGARLLDVRYIYIFIFIFFHGGLTRIAPHVRLGGIHENVCERKFMFEQLYAFITLSFKGKACYEPHCIIPMILTERSLLNSYLKAEHGSILFNFF